MIKRHLFIYLLYVLLGILASVIVAQAWTNPSANPPAGSPGPIPIGNGGTGATTVGPARTNLGAAASGANSDIASITGLTTMLAITQGGTGTNNGSITGTGALTFTAGGTNQNITLAPSGTGSVVVGTVVTPTNKLEVGGNAKISGTLYVNTISGFSPVSLIGELDLSNSNAGVNIGNNINDPSIVLRRLTAGVSSPYIDFANDPTVLYDARLQLTDDNNLAIYGTNLEIPDGGITVGGSGVPAYTIDVVGGGTSTARFGTTSTSTVVIGGGAGKLDTGTVDPIYTIGGERYATYLPGMTGVKEETSGLVNLENGSYEIDFAKAAKGSDLWLFYQVTDFGKNWENLSVLLTPGFSGQAWYQKSPASGKLTIYSDQSGEVSYRLTANRFDYKNWSNSSTSGSDGFILGVK